MAIPYESKSLPAVSTFPFDITSWRGVNKIKGAQADGEMADCKNMCSDNFPYASPRKPREKLIDEADIKRIYKVEGGKVYYIDGEDCLCYCENGVKNYLKYENENGESVNMIVEDVSSSNNYDNLSLFYPSMSFVDGNESFTEQQSNINFDIEQQNDISYRIMSYTSNKLEIQDTEISEITVKNVKKSPSTSYGYPKYYQVCLCIYMFDAEGKNKITGEADRFNGSHYIPIGDLEEVQQESLCLDATITNRTNEYVFTIPEDITLERGDYIKFVLYCPRIGGTENGVWVNVKYLIENIDYASRKFDWFIKGEADTSPNLDYGVVYNNRIVGVAGSDIRASALGDFTNFWEYADEAGNPSATGAYATDVGSAGNFTGICAYNNVLLLFKKDIVYEMYGSMPYTITELCNTGCIDNDSIASIDGVLYWASPKGIVRYSGGVPSVISTQIDIKTDSIAKAGADGRKYYVYDGYKTYVYDTYYQMWHIEDDREVKMRYNHANELYGVYDDGIYKINSGSEAVQWEFETKDFTFGSENRKNLSKLWIRAEMPNNSRLEVYAKQNGTDWQRVAVKTAEKDEMFDFKLRIKKCDSYTLKFKGKGDVRILDIHGKVTVGTSKHRAGASLNVYRK